MNENAFCHQELAGDFHPTHVWGRKLYKMFEEGKLEIVPLSKNHLGKTEYEVSYRHIPSGLYLGYSARFIPGNGVRESVVLSHPVTTRENVRVFHSDDISELEVELDLQLD